MPLSEFEWTTMERLARMESRLVQLMIFLGAELHDNEFGGIKKLIDESLTEYDDQLTN
jgi:hypothetical protein